MDGGVLPACAAGPGARQGMRSTPATLPPPPFFRRIPPATLAKMAHPQATPPTAPTTATSPWPPTTWASTSCPASSSRWALGECVHLWGLGACPSSRPGAAARPPPSPQPPTRGRAQPHDPNPPTPHPLTRPPSTAGPQRGGRGRRRLEQGQVQVRGIMNNRGVGRREGARKGARPPAGRAAAARPCTSYSSGSLRLQYRHRTLFFFPFPSFFFPPAGTWRW